eukprot:5547773-Pleurochrysis_carterae.AAC.1
MAPTLRSTATPPASSLCTSQTTVTAHAECSPFALAIVPVPQPPAHPLSFALARSYSCHIGHVESRPVRLRTDCAS